jgi:hypothetical protein
LHLHDVQSGFALNKLFQWGESSAANILLSFPRKFHAVGTEVSLTKVHGLTFVQFVHLLLFQVCEVGWTMSDIPVPGDSKDDEPREFDILALVDCVGRPHVMRMGVYLETVFRLAHVWMDPDIKDALKYMVLEDDPTKYVQYVTQVLSFNSVIKALIDQTAMAKNLEFDKFHFNSGPRKKDFSKIKKLKSAAGELTIQAAMVRSKDPTFNGEDLSYGLELLFQHFVTRPQLVKFMNTFISLADFTSEDIRNGVAEKLPKTMEFVGMILSMEKLKLEKERVVGHKGTEKIVLSIPLNWESMKRIFGSIATILSWVNKFEVKLVNEDCTLLLGSANFDFPKQMIYFNGYRNGKNLVWVDRKTREPSK